MSRPVLLPRGRNTAKKNGKPLPLRLPAIQNSLDDVRCKAREGQEPADVGVRDALLSGDVVIALAWPLSIRRPGVGDYRLSKRRSPRESMSCFAFRIENSRADAEWVGRDLAALKALFER